MCSGLENGIVNRGESEHSNALGPSGGRMQRLASASKDSQDPDASKVVVVSLCQRRHKRGWKDVKSQLADAQAWYCRGGVEEGLYAAVGESGGGVHWYSMLMLPSIS